MAKPIKLNTLTEDERGILVESIPLLRCKEKYWWEESDFKKQYQKWLTATNSAYHKDGGFKQFKLAIHQMRKTMPNTYKTPEKTTINSNGDMIIRKGTTHDD